uniref:Uncharacterized protein n=2 Tax=Oryza sativa subsp. japonica TaxID=39947 RepID=Q10F68_ORYSJ|nr:hypothetical protein [Oryza sativa Japonica Group]ABF98195.1 hypothetical protein LOC_Os03g47574 [Oryza sativa Japonica Group]
MEAKFTGTARLHITKQKREDNQRKKNQSKWNIWLIHSVQSEKKRSCLVQATTLVPTNMISAGGAEKIPYE